MERRVDVLNLVVLSYTCSCHLYTGALEGWCLLYSHLSNNRGGWNKRGGSAKVAKSINVEVGINVEGGIFWKKLVHKCNKRGVEGGKNLRNQLTRRGKMGVEGGICFLNK